MASSSLLTHKSRSVLTILGIVIGIASITLVMAIGQSAQSLIVGEVQSLGPENIFILPGRQPTGPSSIAGTLLNDSLKQKDFEDLQNKNNVPDAVGVVPYVFSPEVVSYDSQVYDSTLLGSTEGVLKIFNLEVNQGNFFTNDDVLQKSQVAVIGETVAQKLFGLSSPINQQIKIKDHLYRVIGILTSKGQTPFVNFDEAIIMPYSTVQQYVMGIRYFQRITIEASSVDTIPNVIHDVQTVLRTNHNITDPSKDDFNIQTQADVMNTLGTITTILTVLLTSIAAISLLVGGIGIMNIMFVSVTERTKEIGLRKALGATNNDILVQFLAEAIILTILGGVLGVLIGTAFSLLATFVVNRFFALGFNFSFPYGGAFLGVAVSSAIGFIFGLFPARQAARKSPIEALRYE